MSSKQFTVYLIVNQVNGKKYVGLTSGSARRRFLHHCARARNPNRNIALQCAIAKYGPENFSVAEIGRAADRAELQELEKQAIIDHDCRAPNGYNLTAGGDGNQEIYFSPKARKKISKHSKLWWANLTLEQRTEIGKRISLGTKGKKHKSWSTPHPMKGKKRSAKFKSAVSTGMKRYVATLPHGEMRRRTMVRYERK